MSLTIRIDSDGGWDEIKEEFLDPVHKTVVMEHSLVSVHKWEAKYKKPFLMPNYEMRGEELLYYYYCMTITQNVDPTIFVYLTKAQHDEIAAYMNDSHTATTIKDDPNKPKKKNRDVQTAETIYSMMFELNIPYECRKWHLNQLLILIEVRAVQQQPGKKMSNKELMAQNRALNNARKAKHRTRG